MVNVNELKATIVRKGFTQKQVYEAVGLTKRQWDSRLKSKKFNSDEMLDLTDYLEIENPVVIFFAK